MARRKINKSDHPSEYLPYLGDYFYSLYSREWAKEFKWGVNLSSLLTPSFDLLTKLVNLNTSWVKGFKDEIIYHCPFSSNTYYGGIPVAYVSRTKPSLSSPTKEPYQTFWELLMAKEVDVRTLNHISDIDRSLLGHGWNAEKVSQGDGDPKITDIVTQLTQNEYLVFKTWRTKDL